MAAAQVVFLAHDYVPILDTSAYVATMSERGRADKERAAERDAQFKRQAQSIADGFARMIADIVREGILEDNLASLRRFALEEFLTQQSSVLWFDREASSLEGSIRDLRNDRRREAKDIVRETDQVLEDIRWHRDLVVIVRDAYKNGLNSLNAIEPKRLTVEDYATVRAIDEVLPGLKSMQKEFEKRAKSMAAQREDAGDDNFNLRRALAILGGLLIGSVALHFSGVLGALAGASLGAFVAIRFAPLVENR